MKYVSKWGPTIAVKLSGHSNKFYQKGENGTLQFTSLYWGYFGSQMLTTLFCLYWDYVWDWGFFYGKKNKILRDKLTFKPAFYYFALFENTVFRFWWLYASLFISFGDSAFWFDKIELMVMLGVMAELTRRTVWALIRVENEFHNNFEQYRDILVIPPIKDSHDDDDI